MIHKECISGTAYVKVLFLSKYYWPTSLLALFSPVLMKGGQSLPSFIICTVLLVKM